MAHFLICSRVQIIWIPLIFAHSKLEIVTPHFQLSSVMS